jgi:hypothetical protein
MTRLQPHTIQTKGRTVKALLTKVTRNNACPVCGNADRARQVWTDDHFMLCIHCQSVFDPGLMGNDWGVRVVRIVDVLEEMYGPVCKWPPYAETRPGVEKWLAWNNAHYYARPRDSFFESEAIREAIELDKPVVVVEDLS